MAARNVTTTPRMRYGAIPSHLSVCWRQRAVTVSTTATIRFWDQGVLLYHYRHKRMGSEIRPDSCHYLVPISIEIVEEFLGGFGDFGVEGEVLAVDLDGG